MNNRGSMYTSADTTRRLLEDALGDLLPAGDTTARPTASQLMQPPTLDTSQLVRPPRAPQGGVGSSNAPDAWPDWGFDEADVRQWEDTFSQALPWFRSFIFTPGMLFGSRCLWWPPYGPRRTLHEGLDFAQYADPSGDPHPVPAGTPVACLLAGEVVGVFSDFMGKTVALKHDVRREGRTLHSIYGHIAPVVKAGTLLRAGEIVGKIAGNARTAAPAHLHLSAAWLLDPGRAPREWSWGVLSTSVLWGCPAAVRPSQIRLVDHEREPHAASALAHGSYASLISPGATGTL